MTAAVIPIDRARRASSAAGKVPAHNLEAEWSVVCHLAACPDDIELVRGDLAPDAFYSPAYRAIYEAELELDDHDRKTGGEDPIDLVRIRDRLERQGRLGMACEGKPEKVFAEMALEGESHNAAAHTQLILDHAKVRAMQELLHRKAAEGYGDTGPDAQAWVDGVAAAAARLALAHDNQSMPDRLGATATSMLDAASVSGTVSTGLSNLDAGIGRLRRGDLYLFQAPPANGKTALGLNVAMNVAEPPAPIARPDLQGEPVLFFSLEMPKDRLLFRAACRVAQLDNRIFLDEEQTQEEATKLTRAGLEIASWPLYVVDTPGLGPERLGTIAIKTSERLRKVGQRLALVVIDYYQMLGCPKNMKPRATRCDELNEGGLAMVRLAKRLDCPIILLAKERKGDGEVADCTAMGYHVHNRISVKLGQHDGSSADAQIAVKKLRDREVSGDFALAYYGQYYHFSDTGGYCGTT